MIVFERSCEHGNLNVPNLTDEELRRDDSRYLCRRFRDKYECYLCWRNAINSATDQWNLLKSDPKKYLPVLVEEILRLEGPVQGLFHDN